LAARLAGNAAEDRADNPAVGAAPAQVAVQGLPDVFARRGGVLLQQVHRGHHHARGAVAALSGLLVEEGLLDRMQAAAGRQPLDGRDRAVRARDRQVAGGPGAPVDQHEARPAQAQPATEARPGEAQVMAENIEQRRVGLAADGVLNAIDDQEKFFRLHNLPHWPAAAPPAAGPCRGFVTVLTIASHKSMHTFAEDAGN
jgi:hypothetical protein